MSTTWLILQLRNDNHLTKSLLAFERTKGSLISETFSLFKSQKKWCEITRLSTIHVKRRCSGEWFGTFFLRFEPKWNTYWEEITFKGPVLWIMILPYTTTPVWRYHLCTYLQIQLLHQDFSNFLKNPIVLKPTELYN